MEGLVSIIVPIYNAHNYLRKCVESIQRQRYQNIEIILVDDGSIDDSGEICDSFVKKDLRIHVIHKENGGNTSARRAGLAVARGEYVTFVDADDSISDNLVSDLLYEMKKSESDVVISNVTKSFSYGDIEVKNKFSPGTYEKSQDIVRNMFYYKDTDEIGVLPFLHAKLFKYDFIIRGFESIGDCVQCAEDWALTFWCVLNASRINFVDKSYYKYNIHEGSICQSKDERYLEKITQFYIYTKHLFEKEKESEHLLKQLDRYMVEAVVNGINRKIGLSQNDLITKYYLDESKLNPSNQVVLYGAGAVGRDFYKQLLRSEKVHISMWVDQNYKRYREENLPVESLDCLKKIEYEYIIIAVLRENVLENIVDGLEKISVPRGKIVWIKPQKIF